MSAVSNQTLPKYVHSNCGSQFFAYKRDDNTYQRIVCKWKENESLTHNYHVTVNVKTGDLYMDCRKRKIFAKHLALTVARPFHITAKTAWHASIIGPLAYQAIKLVKGKQTKKDFSANMIKSLQDIYRTPGYGAAMIATNISAVIMGTFKPNTLYHTRALAGRLEREMLRADRLTRHTKWVMSPCFSPLDHLSNYEDSKALATFTEKQVNYQRKYRIIFNRCMRRFPKNKAYISAAAA